MVPVSKEKQCNDPNVCQQLAHWKTHGSIYWDLTGCKNVLAGDAANFLNIFLKFSAKRLTMGDQRF